MESAAQSEYKEFIYRYLLQIIGIPIQSDKTKDEIIINVDKHVPSSKYVFDAPDEKRVYFSDYSGVLFFVESKADIDKENIRAAVNIVQMFFKISEYSHSGSKGSTRIEYPSDAMRYRAYESAVQEGICRWMIGGKNPSTAKLVHTLENWSVKTYEGKKVTFAFIINPDERSSFSENSSKSWLDFLKSDYSATLTDCIHSAIMLDSNCDFVKYISLTQGNTFPQYRLGRLPYRFAGLIRNHVIGKCVGVFLLNNGDILLSKRGELRFVKRNLKWLNVSFTAFNNSIKEYIIDTTLIENIYSTVLDVSFAHTGGIVAVVDDITELTKKEILNEADYLLNSKSISELRCKCANNMSEDEINRILLKRAAISAMIAVVNFSNLDRKLRTELVSMDGACILDTAGNICAAGAIIKNDSGSSEGGRGAAAKKLSNHGVAIKISTDGYVEVYKGEEIVFSIK